jgi:hypothetical protein
MESLFHLNVPLAHNANVFANVRQLTETSNIVDVYFSNQQGISVLLGQKQYETNVCTKEQTARAILDVCYDVEAQIAALSILQQKVLYGKNNTYHAPINGDIHFDTFKHSFENTVQYILSKIEKS